VCGGGGMDNIDWKLGVACVSEHGG
jgi:hypothetical protein